MIPIVFSNSSIMILAYDPDGKVKLSKISSCWILICIFSGNTRSGLLIQNILYCVQSFKLFSVTQFFSSNHCSLFPAVVSFGANKRLYQITGHVIAIFSLLNDISPV